VSGEKREEKRKRDTLEKLYWAADPAIRRLPGRSLEEKRAIFNLALLTATVLLYLSPLPWLSLQHLGTAHGLLLSLVFFVAIPLALARYVVDLLAEYGEALREAREKRRKREEGKTASA